VPTHVALFRFTTDNAERIYQTLVPELAGEVNSRSVTRCWLEGSHILVLQVEARDVSAMRAALNMFLRLISVADEMQDLVR
jgi:KEOPS complex subunit Pcc1